MSTAPPALKNAVPQALKQLQTDFSGAIFSEQRDAIADAVLAQGELSASERVGIYRNSVHGILWQYLASLYPVCNQLVGEKFFEGFCDLFIDQHPPATPFLADYGTGFAAFIQQHPAFAKMRWIHQVAALEWARHQAWHAVNQPATDFAALATLTEAQQPAVKFRLPESMQLLHSPYAIHHVWLAHQPEDHPEKIALEDIQLEQENYVMVWRKQRELHQLAVSQQQWAFLTALQQQQTLAEVTETFQEQSGGLLTQAIQSGWVISFNL
jgi:hypothetical protein